MKPNRNRNEWDKQKCVKKRDTKNLDSKQASVKIGKEDDEEAEKKRTNPTNYFCAAFELKCFFFALLSHFSAPSYVDCCLQCKVFQTIYSLAKYFIIKLSMVLRRLRVLNMCLDSPDYFVAGIRIPSCK